MLKEACRKLLKLSFILISILLLNSSTILLLFNRILSYLQFRNNFLSLIYYFKLMEHLDTLTR